MERRKGSNRVAGVIGARDGELNKEELLLLGKGGKLLH